MSQEDPFQALRNTLEQTQASLQELRTRHSSPPERAKPILEESPMIKELQTMMQFFEQCCPDLKDNKKETNYSQQFESFLEKLQSSVLDNVPEEHRNEILSKIKTA